MGGLRKPLICSEIFNHASVENGSHESPGGKGFGMALRWWCAETPSSYKKHPANCMSNSVDWKSQ